MIAKGIRGAITVESNTEESIKQATIELLTKMIEVNRIDISLISHIIFTTTNDLNAAFPAKFARQDMEFTETAMMCFNELDVPGALKMCIRILIVLNCKDDFKPHFIYLRDAKSLRS